MTFRKLTFLLTALCAGTFTGTAANVSVEMNAVSKTMTLQSKSTGQLIETGTPSGTKYTFEAAPGDYVLTGYGTDGTTVNGTIEITVADTDEVQEFKILTCTAYATNKNWTVANGDYTIEATVTSREGDTMVTTIGSSTTAGRHCFLALNGNSYYVALIPSANHQAEGYTALYKSGTLTFNVNINGAIPLGGDYTITLPADADIEIGIKKTHFTPLNVIEPKSVATKGDRKEVTYYLAQGQVYAYRTWRDGGLTQGGYFTYAADEAKRPALDFTADDYESFAPATIIHDVNYNQGYETGDIFVNINERGHLALNVGDTFLAHAMRTWQLTDNSTNNFFIEPDFHYTVIDPGGNPSQNVIEITQQATSPWAQIKAVGNGTAIVLVTYDAIGLNYYTTAGVKTPYLGGEYWSAIWPENTAAYVVTVGESASTVVPNMLINEDYNTGALKMSGKNVDAEHDIFYFLDTEEGAYYTFKPEGVEELTMAYPQIGDRMASYHGFGTEGVTRNEDGSYTLLLKEGRQIVRMTDAAGNASYQVITAKPCHREITNASNPGSDIFQPGDDIKIQYSGLRHPANRLAGIYNMSAYVTYNGIPNGSSLILGAGQYTFGSAPSAQAVTISIPADHDALAQPSIDMTEGVIQVNGYGDPIGNHRFIDPVGGRSPNFTAIAHKTYFGMIPDVTIPVTPYRSFPIRIEANAPGAEVVVTYRGKELTPDEESGTYTGSYGSYDFIAKADEYRCYRNTFHIADDAEGEQLFTLTMLPLDGAWDGKTMIEPTLTDGVYEIATGEELAWLANAVNSGSSADARLIADIDLGDFDWTPIGTSSKPFGSDFDGDNHTVSGLYIDTPKANNCGLFGYIKGSSANAPASVKGVTVKGKVSAKQYAAGVAGYLHQYSTVERCTNLADVTGAGTYIGGVVGYMGNASATVTDCCNAGTITGTTNCGGVVGGHVAKAVVSNVFNIGEVNGSKVAACVGGTSSKENMTNIFALKEYDITEQHTLVTDLQMSSGEIAHTLGEAFGQTLGEDNYPVLNGAKVYKVDYIIVPQENSPALFSDDTDSLYTNGQLPEWINGEKATWYADEEMRQPVSTTDCDARLFVKLGDTTGVEDVEATSDTDVRWYNLRGIEVPAPAPGVNGIFIRVANGTSKKIKI